MVANQQALLCHWDPQFGLENPLQVVEMYVPDVHFEQLAAQTHDSHSASPFLVLHCPPALLS